MSRGINKVIIVGNLGQDPETRAMPGGTTVANISVATSERWKDKQSGEAKERTEWHRIAFFGRLAEIAGEYLKKGSKVYVEGSLRTLALAGCSWAVGRNDIETAQKLCETNDGVKWLERENANLISVTCMNGMHQTVKQVRADWPAVHP